MSGQPNFLVLKADGTNCDRESARAVRLAGGSAEVVHVSQLEYGDRKLSDYQGLFIPGGFSAGDAVRAGVMLALRLKRGRIGDDIQKFNDERRPVLGICNGFQVLTEMGLLPGENMARWEKAATLRPNASGRFESRWVDLRLNGSALSPFTAHVIAGSPRVRLPIANGEGRFTADPERIRGWCRNGQVLMYYANGEGEPSMDPADNPSGSMGAIAAVCNVQGNVMGSMPHIERNIFPRHEPHRRHAGMGAHPAGLVIMRSIVAYARQI